MVPHFDNREGYIWLNGDFVEWADAKLHVLSHALHYASSVFEGERVYKRKIFKLEEHTERLFYSANKMDMEIPFTMDEVNDACNTTVNKNNIIDGYVRPIAWRGAEMMGVSAQNTKINFAVAVWEWPSYFDPDERLKGIRLSLSKWRRPSPETIPCDTKAAGLYMICTLSKHDAEKNGYADSLMLDFEGYIAEATGANVFFIKNNEIHTPSPDCFLDGITRRTVIELAKKRGISIIQRKISPDEMNDFTECFLTGTAVEVTPVSQIGDYNFEPSQITKQLMEDYISLVNS
ncbi:MAG: branched-chain amino acid aminotransferase [Rhodobiaceae bacterium]|nr:branched-chain amino acid aminotransferase [Rhodobiaceae bacterium]MAU57765.1 branched-chain amino acid aminotransferase [Rhodobiaceae bacterium]MDC3084527.1 branched-chain amino acid aminotransferase [Gammaproteobacteria bacterium]OUT81805.1 MAG: branched-chain amino acid aminotransferase [Rhizobiales bacterium TMED28]RZO33711.1 MAG: branched-chain amino acid aminotransferase [Hyphomicrobiales bacterium]|tara:strand:+ start:2623 stop:3492 length:870 start_codon:yes stop_codon:yes gene_type:complete